MYVTTDEGVMTVKATSAIRTSPSLSSLSAETKLLVAAKVKPQVKGQPRACEDNGRDNQPKWEGMYLREDNGKGHAHGRI